MQRGKLDQDDKPAVVKEEDRQRDESFDHKSEEGNKETKLSEGTASSTDTKQDDNDAVFGEPDLEENWKTNMQKTVLKMRAALKDKLVKLGFQPEGSVHGTARAHCNVTRTCMSLGCATHANCNSIAICMRGTSVCV